ncbi:MAG TPA: nucleotidyltransferase family protein [Bacteroidota bacterium]|nr:nucleotidyltransferase family protein [Bacteroidota bacterium]
MISAIVLAAGASARMGEPKAILKIGEKTFLQHIVDVLYSACILDTVIVLGNDAVKIQNTLDWFQGKVVINDNWQQGQLSSIIAGMNRLNGTDLHGVMICPVDHPLISQGLLVDLLQTFWKSKKKIVLPVYDQKRGHPVIFSKELFDELKSAPINVGARFVVRQHSNDVAELVTTEEGVVQNIDTPEDYEMKILSRLK